MYYFLKDKDFAFSDVAWTVGVFLFAFFIIWILIEISKENQ